MTDLEIPETGAVFTFGKSRFAENKPSHFFIKNDPVVHVACGDEHTAVICKNGRIFAFGSNEWGQLGLGHNNMVHKPSCVKALKPEKAKLITCGRAHTIILTESNNVYACGSNTDGQLGLETVDMVNTPTKLQHSQLHEHGPISKISAGSQHSAALTASGLVFVWGSNSEGQLGLESNKTNSKLPTLLEFQDKVRDISCGYYHTAVLTASGQLFTCGDNENGKLGVAQGESQVYKPTRVQLDLPLARVVCGGGQNFGLTADGHAVAFGSNVHGELGVQKDVTWVPVPQLLPLQLFDNETLIGIACGEVHTAFLTESFKIYTCGDTRHGKLCQEDGAEDGHFGPTLVPRFNEYQVTHVSCGGCHTIVCAQRVDEDTAGSTVVLLPPLQRIPNSILHSDAKPELATSVVSAAEHLANGLNEIRTEAEVVTDVVRDTAAHGLKETLDKSSGIDHLPDEISEIVKAQKEQLDAEYDKTIIGTQKHDSKPVAAATATATDDVVQMEEHQQQIETQHEKTGDTATIGVDKLSEIAGLRPLKDHLVSDSVDNLLQEIEDDLSSDKTVTSDTVSVKSNNGRQSTPVKDIDVKDEVTTHVVHETDDDDLKTETPMAHSETKMSKLFGTFKRKKVSASTTLDSRIVDVEAKIGSKISLENSKKEEVTNGKTDKTKTCTIL